MKITILGSGGFQTIPRPTCQCKICKEARKKGVPYSRNGPAIYIHEAEAIIDAPKDIINSINRENIKSIKNLLFTHWHPDHTEGMRFLEEMLVDWKNGELKNHNQPVNMIIPKEVWNEIKLFRSGSGGSIINWYNYLNLIKEIELPVNKTKIVNGIKFKPVLINNNKRLTTIAWLITENSKKILYLPCDVKPFDIDKKYLKNLDIFIVNSPWFESKKGLEKIDKNHSLRKELFSFEEIKELIENYKIKKTIIVHIEEMWQLSYDDYKKLEKKYSKQNIKFAYDGMRLRI